MVSRMPHAARSHCGSRLLAAVVLGAFASQLLPEDLGFAAPAALSPSTSTGLAGQEHAWAGPHGWGMPGHTRIHDGRSGEAGRTALQAAPVAAATIGQKVMAAVGAGAVAAVIQAALSAVCEPIVNRVLVKRMKIADAMKEVTPSMMLKFFQTTISTNLLKFPLFEAINALCAVLPIPGAIRGIFTGFVFTTATLPVTNFRYRQSMQLEITLGNIYEAYLPTVIRDMVYGVLRNYFTVWVVGMNAAWKSTSPQVMFIVVILSCLGSAPFNEWRGFLLQSKGKTSMTFGQFFKPANFIRSTSLGAMQQGIALALGYWCAPPAAKYVHLFIDDARHLLHAK